MKTENRKGHKGENCNRTACQQPPANYYNHSTRAWYCAECAAKINSLNPESYQIYGHELCTHLWSTPTLKALNIQS